MKKSLVLPLLALSVVGLSGCSKKEEANNWKPVVHSSSSSSSSYKSPQSSSSSSTVSSSSSSTSSVKSSSSNVAPAINNQNSGTQQALQQSKQENSATTTAKSSTTHKDFPTASQPNNAQGRIVGNSKSMIYHVPGGRSYKKVSEKNAVYFNSEEEAQAAGYRKAER